MSRLSAPRRQALARLAKHGPTGERDTCTRMLGRELASAGLVDRTGPHGKVPTLLTITASGRAALNPEIDTCDCRECRPKDPRIKP